MEILQELNNYLTREGTPSELKNDSLFIKHQIKSEKEIKNIIIDWGYQNNINFVMNIEKIMCSPNCPVCQGQSPIVRVVGFTAYFTDMEVQDQIIARTQQKF